jgi:hypothetical protein
MTPAPVVALRPPPCGDLEQDFSPRSIVQDHAEAMGVAMEPDRLVDLEARTTGRWALAQAMLGLPPGPM